MKGEQIEIHGSSFIVHRWSLVVGGRRDTSKVGLH
jgi:hypothetical protein